MKVILSAADAKALSPTATALVRCPAQFSGTLGEFAERFIVPNLPTGERVEALHALLATYITRPDALFLLRAVTGTERRKKHATREGVRFKATDNAPAWWVHSVLLQPWSIAPGAFANVVATLPTHFHDVAKTCGPTANEAGYHVAHLYDVKDGNTDFAGWSRADVAGRFIRNVHPCNYFLLAKTDWQQWGGDERVLGFFHALYRERYASVWEEFVELAGVRERDVPEVRGPAAYSYTADGSAATGRRARAVGPTFSPGQSDGVVEYRASRLTFKRDVIEPLADGDAFRVVTPLGVFQMTKGDMYRVFPGVPMSVSYREGGTYNYATLPRAAEQFRVT